MTARLNFPQRISLALSAMTVALSLWSGSALAGDPFRSSNPRNIGDKTEAAFEAIFRDGNYLQARQYLLEAKKTEANEPLVYVMQAYLAYFDGDLETLKTSGSKTLQVARQLKASDPLRSNLYVAVGTLLEGAYAFKQQGPVGAIPKLQEGFEYLDAAEKVAPNDPELNLIKGYSDLILSIYLPFSTPEQAIERFEQYAKPDYMVDRSIAVAYRDLKQYDRALSYMDKALQVSPDNPELQYLKGQILRSQGRKTQNVSLLKQALPYFEQAKKKEKQLPKSVQISLNHEYNAVQTEIKEVEGKTRAKN